MEFEDNRNGIAIQGGRIHFMSNGSARECSISDIEGFGFLQANSKSYVNFVKAGDRYEYQITVTVRGQSNIVLENHAGTTPVAFVGQFLFTNKAKRQNQQDFFKSAISLLMQCCTESVLLQIIEKMSRTGRWQCDAFYIENSQPYVNVKGGIFKSASTKKLQRGTMGQIDNGVVVVSGIQVAPLSSVNAWAIPMMLELYAKGVF